MASKKKSLDEARYAYTIADDADPSAADQSGDKFDADKLLKGRAMMIEAHEPDRKAMRYMPDDSLSGFFNPKAGAGRGKQGGPTAKELKEAGMKKGGSVSSASKRADGIAQRGKTRGTIVMCGGGMYKK